MKVIISNFAGKTANFVFVISVVCFCFIADQIVAQPQESAATRRGNVLSPIHCPVDPEFVAFERLENDTKRLYLLNRDSEKVIALTQNWVGSELTSKDIEWVLPGLSDSSDGALSSSEGQLDWRRLPDSTGRFWFAYTSNGPGYDFDIYLSYFDKETQLISSTPIRLSLAGAQQYPKWSPDGQSIVFSSETEKGEELYLLPDAGGLMKGGQFSLSALVQLTNDSVDDSRPVWSPEGRYIAYQSQQIEDDLKNSGVNVINIKNPAKSVRITGELSNYHEYQPSWSPDGQYIAYYVSRDTVGEASIKSLQDIGVVKLLFDEESDRVEGGAVVKGQSLLLAENVLPASDRGPQWFSGINKKSKEEDRGVSMLIYVKQDEVKNNPIEVVNFNRWLNVSGVGRPVRAEISKKYNTSQHRDVFLYGSNLAYVSQVDGVNEVRTALFGKGQIREPGMVTFTSEKQAWAYSLVPGLTQWRKGEKRKSLMVGGGWLASIAAYAFFSSDYNEAQTKYNAAQKAYGLVPDDANAQTFKDTFSAWKTAKNDLSGAALRTNLAIGVVGAIWAFNFIDSNWNILQKIGVGRTKSSNYALTAPYFKKSSLTDSNTRLIGISLNF